MTTTNGQRRALAELIHQIRPDWDRHGIQSALNDDTRPIQTLAHVAVDAAMDPTSRTPAVIPTRDRTSYGTAETPPTPQPAKACTKCLRVHDPDQQTCQVPNPDLARRGAERARRALKAAQ